MGRKNVIDHVKKRNDSLPEYRFGPLTVYVQEKLSDNVSLNSVFEDVMSLVPSHFLELVDVVYIGQFSFLHDRNINAMYLDGAIYVSNVQDDEEDLKDDIVHEISHAVEDKHGYVIYSDGNIKDEFLQKRSKLKNILSNEGYDIDGHDFMNTEFDEDFDNMLYDEVGYDALRLLAVNLFLGPYSVVSLREYFARAFEEYFLGEHVYLRELCPYVYKKLSLLSDNDIEEIDHEI